MAISFAAFLKDFGSVWGASAAGIAATPFVMSFAALAPPLDGVVPATSAILIVLLAAAYSWAANPQRKAGLIRWAPRLCLMAPIAFLFYMAMWATFTYKLPENGQNIFLGCGYVPLGSELARLFNAPDGGCPGQFERLLSAVNDDPAKVWTRSSIIGVELVTLAFWLCFLATAAIGVSAHLTTARKNSTRRRQKKAAK
jgi:hypothetical protein